MDSLELRDTRSSDRLQREHGAGAAHELGESTCSTASLTRLRDETFLLPLTVIRVAMLATKAFMMMLTLQACHHL